MSEGGRSVYKFLLLSLISALLIPTYFVLSSSMPILSFPEISIASVNCNSLNMSALSSHQQKLKIYGITKLKTVFILLSDIRLSKSGLGTLSELSNLFLINPYCGYKLIHNSSKTNENILAIRLKLKGAELTSLVSMALTKIVMTFLTTFIMCFQMSLICQLLWGGTESESETFISGNTYYTS